MSTIRITSGTLRNRRVPVPQDKVRPTSERARQAFFNIVGERIVGARFLDLFSGSGVFAFEAISRGAKCAVAIDNSRKHTEAIDALARELEVDVKTMTADVFTGIKHLGAEVFDVIYADPPYLYERYDELLLTVDGAVPLAEGAVVAFEHKRGTNPFKSEPKRLQFDRRAEYGEVWITFFIA
jgi:16S rRNA (guanine966-N2)-methyltransferase